MKEFLVVSKGEKVIVRAEKVFAYGTMIELRAADNALLGAFWACDSWLDLSTQDKANWTLIRFATPKISWWERLFGRQKAGAND